MSKQQQLDELLDRWEELQERGKVVSPEEMCRECPELLADFKRLAAALQHIDGFILETPQSDSAMLVAAGRYQPLKMHAQGGIGDVLLAQDAELERVVALKRIRMLDARHPDRCRHFQFEAQITGRLEHPGIVPVYGFERDAKGRLFYAMRLIQGDTLEDAINKFHKLHPLGSDAAAATLPFQKLIRSFLTVCQTIGYAHNQGIIHRDLKPANIMVGQYGETLVVDWGLAKRIAPKIGVDDDTIETNPAAPTPFAGEAEQTVVGLIKGSPAFMSPEQATGDTSRIGVASDVYSLGATLYTILAGQKPIAGSSLSEVIDNAKLGRFPKPSAVRRDVPRALEAICLKAMSRDPADRYETPLSLAADIEHWLADDPVSAWREPWSKRAGRWLMRHRTAAASLAAALTVAFVALGITSVVLSHKNEELVAANRAAEENFDQSHATLRDVIDFALRGRTLGDNLALDPVRLDILERAVKYVAALRTRKPDDQQLVLENALLLTALGEVETRLGKPAKASEHFQQGFDLYGDPQPDELLDQRHGRALARLRLAETRLHSADKTAVQNKAQLQQSCGELAKLVEQKQSGSLVMSFNELNAPEILLTQGLFLSLSDPSPNEQQWLKLVDDGLENIPRTSDIECLTAASMRGILWYSVGARASRRIPTDIKLVLHCCDQARGALKESVDLADKLTPNRDNAAIYRWMLAQTDALHAGCLAENGQRAETLKELNAVCNEEQRLLPQLQLEQNAIIAAWKAIDPSSANEFAEAVPGADPRLLKFYYADNLRRLAEATADQGLDATAQFERLEVALTALDRSDAISVTAKIMLGRCQARLGAFFFQPPQRAEKAKQFLTAAVQTLESARTPVAENPEIDYWLCFSYTMLSNLTMHDSKPEAIHWLEKTEACRQTLSAASAPSMFRHLAATAAEGEASALWFYAEPRPDKKIWQAAREALSGLDSPPRDSSDKVPAMQIRDATDLLARSAVALTETLGKQQPVPNAEIIRICEPSLAALRRLPDLVGPLTPDEKDMLQRLTQIRTANSP